MFTLWNVAYHIYMISSLNRYLLKKFVGTLRQCKTYVFEYLCHLLASLKVPLFKVYYIFSITSLSASLQKFWWLIKTELQDIDCLSMWQKTQSATTFKLGKIKMTTLSPSQFAANKAFFFNFSHASHISITVFDERRTWDRYYLL